MEHGLSRSGRSAGEVSGDGGRGGSPTLAFQRTLGSGFEIERSIVQNVLALLTLPRRREIAEARFVQAQARAAEMTPRLGS